MAETLVSSCSSQCSLLLLQPKLGFRAKFSIRNRLSFALKPVSNRQFEVSNYRQNLPIRVVVAGVASESTDPSVVGEEAVVKDIEVRTDSGGGEGGDIVGGGGEGGGGGDDYVEPGEGGPEPDEDGKKIPMSMSQKLTLGFAALVAVGGLMGFVKGGSQKSLLAGGISASILFYVYTLLPTNPTFASALGLGVSAALLTVMGSRFKKSGKVFPAGVVSFVSLVMTGGYLHGIMRGMH